MEVLTTFGTVGELLGPWVELVEADRAVTVHELAVLLESGFEVVRGLADEVLVYSEAGDCTQDAEPDQKAAEAVYVSTLFLLL